MGVSLLTGRFVSTHSRLKAAGPCYSEQGTKIKVSTHSRLKAAGGQTYDYIRIYVVSTHSRLKAAGAGGRPCVRRLRGFNTQPPEGGWTRKRDCLSKPGGFQHTAA